MKDLNKENNDTLSKSIDLKLSYSICVISII